MQLNLLPTVYRGGVTLGESQPRISRPGIFSMLRMWCQTQLEKRFESTPAK